MAPLRLSLWQIPTDLFPPRQVSLEPITVPVPNMRKIQLFPWGEPPQRQFVQDAGCYVYQARLEGLEAEQRFFKAFYAALKRRWPKLRDENPASEIGQLALRSFQDVGALLNTLARDLGWAASFATAANVYGFLHWEKAFQLTGVEWENEARQYRIRLRDGRANAARRTPRVRQLGDSDQMPINVDTLQLGDCVELPILIDAIDDEAFETSVRQHIYGNQIPSGPARPPFGYRLGA